MRGEMVARLVVIWSPGAVGVGTTRARLSSRSGEFRTRRGKWRFDDEPTSVKRARRRALPPIEEFDATDGLPEGDRWSTWETEKLVPNV